MYQVTIDGRHLCSTNAANGFAAVEDPTAKLIVNGADSFVFTVYPQHPLYGEIVCKVSRVKIQQDGKLIFYGTVSGYTETLYGVRTYSCEGALSWLNELCLPAYHLSNMTPKQVLSWYIEMYNDTVQDASKKFTVGSVTIAKATTKAGTEGTIARSSGLFPTFWEEISEKLLDAFGGILRIRYKGTEECAGVIDWLAIPDATCGQDIKYAKNLIDCDWSYDGTPIATAVIPLGKKQGGSTEDEVRIDIHKTNDASMTALLKHLFGHGDFVKSGNMVYSKSRVEKYGLIQQTVTFDDESNTDNIAYLGAVWLDQNGKASSTIRAEAIDIADIDETVSHFVCGDYVRAWLPGSTQDLIFPITAIEIPIAAPDDARITVGTQETSAASGGSGGSITEVGSGADALAHTHANKGVLDRITAQDYADFKGAVNKAHIHQNQETLDKIDETAWLTVYGQVHKHDNKDVLDQITQTEWITINSAKNKAHTHDNKDTLDKIDDVSWLTVYGQTHEHSNKTVLDKLTAQDYSDFKGTVNKAHVHSNKDTLDKLDGEWWAMWLSAYGNMHTHANKAALDKITDALVTKLSNMDLSKYLPLAGGVMNGDIDLVSNGVDLLVGTQRATNTSYATAIAGATINTKQAYSDGLTARKSLIGSYLDSNNVWQNIVSVRHRNGANDGANFGMYLRSALTSGGNLIWNKQTAANTWQGERTLLDTTNYSSYASNVNHTHRIIDRIGNVGYYGSDAASSDGWYKFYSGTLTGYSDVNARLSIMSTYAPYHHGILDFNIRCENSNRLSVHVLHWEVRYGFHTDDVIVALDGNNYSLYVNRRNPQYGRIKIRVLESGGTASAWDMILASNFTKETTAPTPTVAASDGCTVANATTWNGLTDDTATYNSADTWLLVKNGNKIQHRLSYELEVKRATTLTDTGWEALPRASTTPTLNYPGVNYRKYGKMVTINGGVVFASDQSGPVIGQLPEGCRPVVQEICAVGIDKNTYSTFFINIKSDGTILFSTKTAGFFKKNTMYYINETFFVS